MGIYVEDPDNLNNPVPWVTANCDKLLIRAPESVHENGFDSLPIVLIDHGRFMAAGIAYNQLQLDYFSCVDTTNRTYYSVRIDKLRTVCPRLDAYLKDSISSF